MSKPIKANITLEATNGAPALAAMIAKLLEQAGAEVSFSDKRISKLSHRKVNLQGLKVNFGRLVWAREEEADRW